MRIFIISLICVIIPLLISAENKITGILHDPEGIPLQGVIVRLYENESLKSYTSTNKDGSFVVKADSITFPAKIVFISRLFSKLEHTVENYGNQGDITLYPEEYTIEEIYVSVPRTRMHGDTIIYDVASYTDKGDRNIEDVLRKLPGVRVEDNGSITYDGEPINNFYIEGLDLMGSNYAVASRSIRPEDISSVSVYERHQPKKVLKNVAESKRAALNLKLKKNRLLRPVGHIKGGAGGSKENALWAGELYGMFIAPNTQTIISAKGNNAGSIYNFPRSNNDAAFDLLSQTPFGSPPILPDRYMTNKSAYFSANTLLRPKEGLTLSINTSYAIEHDSFDGLSSIEYLGSGEEENIVFSEKTDNSLRNHILSANAKIERNIDNFFFSDQFVFTGRFCGNSYDILSDGHTMQDLNSDNYSFSNTLSTIIKHNRKVYEISSLTIYKNSPQNSMTATNMATGNSFVRQNITGQSLFNKETTSFSWIISPKNSCGVRIAFEAKADKFSSDGDNGSKNANKNSLSGYAVITTGEPFYKFAIPGKFIWETSFPISIRNQKYSNLISGNINKWSNVYVDMASSVFYKINPFQHSEITFGWNHEHGGLKDFIDNPVYTSYRSSLIPGSGESDNSLNKYIRGSYFLRNPAEGFYLNAILSMNIRSLNSMTIYDVDSQGTSTSKTSQKNNSSTANIAFTISKNIWKWNTSISLNGSGFFTSRKSQRSNTNLNVKNNVYILTARIESIQFNELMRITTDVSYSYNNQSFKPDLPKTSFDELSINGKLSMFPIKNWEFFAYANYNRSKISSHNYKGNLFVDVGILYSFKKFNLEFSARNLSNSKQYAYTLYRTLDIVSYSYKLRPIEALISLRYNF